MLPATPAAAQEVKNYPLVGPAQLSEDGQRLIIGNGAGSDPAQTVRERYEEIEILGHLINRGLARDAGVKPFGDWIGSAFSPDGRVMATQTTAGGNVLRHWDAQTGKAIAALDFSRAQGVYLKGQGIVYALTIPLHTQKVVAEASKPAAKELTEWDRIRKELHGEKVEAAKPQERGQASLADTVLKVIAENGKHLTRLPEGESVTVAITLPSMQSCVACHTTGKGGGSGMMPGGMGSGGSGMSGGMAPGGAPGRLPTGGTSGISRPAPMEGSPAAGGGSAEADGRRAELRKHALLGDLAMKQRDYNQAVEEFLKASGAYKEAPRESDAQLELIEVATKLARAFMAQGKKAEAERIMQSIAKLGDGLAAGGAPANVPAGKAEVPLPDKLIIKVPKTLIDQMGLGKMTLDEFRKAASVEHLTFDKPAEKKQ
jgi:hypothetical protein